MQVQSAEESKPLAQNRDGQAYLVRISALRDCMIAAFARVGMQAEYAGQIAAVLLDSELRGTRATGSTWSGTSPTRWDAGL